MGPETERKRAQGLRLLRGLAIPHTITQYPPRNFTNSTNTRHTASKACQQSPTFRRGKVGASEEAKLVHQNCAKIPPQRVRCTRGGTVDRRRNADYLRLFGWRGSAPPHHWHLRSINTGLRAKNIRSGNLMPRRFSSPKHCILRIFRAESEFKVKSGPKL